jgi:hypothetical protein
MSPAGFESANPERQSSQAYALNRAAADIGRNNKLPSLKLFVWMVNCDCALR